MENQWYYAVNGQQRGPVDESELKRMLSRGEVRADDLVWKDGMEDWKPLSTALPGVVDEIPVTPRPGDASGSPVVTSAATGFGAPVEGTEARRLGLKYDFGDYLCWGIAIALVPCVAIFGYIALMVMFVLEFIELKKAVDEGRIESSQYSRVNPVLLILGLFCCSIIFYPLFMHWRNQTKVFKPQPHAVWFAILIMLLSIGVSLLLNGAAAFTEAMSTFQGSL
ncbi:MAG: DUF4339 domain-containing protein [Candidatus Methylacidiphilales bacterium]